MDKSTLAGMSSDSDAENDVLRAVLARKAKQALKKSQPRKGVYTPKLEDQPRTSSPHDKPWIRERQDDEFNWTDEGYDSLEIPKVPVPPTPNNTCGTVLN
ncbi:hypothetical protein F4679DRAFT_401578 [Xylaria curta]|nr:hypothetical protein F4679DRAFT_401578 [Xylaria curta]